MIEECIGGGRYDMAESKALNNIWLGLADGKIMIGSECTFIPSAIPNIGCTVPSDSKWITCAVTVVIHVHQFDPLQPTFESGQSVV